MRALAGKADEEVTVDFHSASGIDIDLPHHPWNSLRVELRVPRAVERVCGIHAPAVATHLDHLRTTCPLGARRMLRAMEKATQLDGGRMPRRERIHHVVLQEL